MTPEEGQRKLADAKKENEMVPVVPNISYKMRSGVTLTISSAEVTRRKLRVTGTIINTTTAPTLRGTYYLDLNQSFEEQVAKYEKISPGVADGESPGLNSHFEAPAAVPPLQPGKSYPYSVTFEYFTMGYPHLQPSDMIMVPLFVESRGSAPEPPDK